MSQGQKHLINWARHSELRMLMDADFPRLMSSYRGDAARWIAAIEQASAAQDAVAMVRPAHTLQGDSFQFGAEAVGEVAETIEHMARSCADGRRPPELIRHYVARLRPLLAKSLDQFEREDQRQARFPPLAMTTGD